MTETDESLDRLIFVIDSSWHPTEDLPNPPVTALLGVWPMSEEGDIGRFQPNPAYLPSAPDSPLDPVDATLRLLGQGVAVTDELPHVLAGVMFGIAVDEQGVAVVRPAPDGVASVLVTTAYPHRSRVDDVAGWRDITLDQLAEALPPDGVDVLINPGASTSMRILAEVFRTTATRTATPRGSDGIGKGREDRGS